MDYSATELTKFFDYVLAKGLMNPSTARARKIAAEKVLGVLTDDEKKDLRELERDRIFQRFMNLRRNDFTPDSLNTYRQRFGSALDDFISYVTNPTAFRPSGTQRSPRTIRIDLSPSDRETAVTKKSASNERAQTAVPSPEPVPPGLFTFPVPLPSGAIAQLNLPREITPADAERISAVVKALAISADKTS